MEAKPASGARTFGSNHRLLVLVGPLKFSHLQVTKGPKQRLHEIENDLIAGHYHSNGSRADMQFGNAKMDRDQREVWPKKNLSCGSNAASLHLAD